MFASVVTALALAASVSRVAASPIAHVVRDYAQDAKILEDYTPFHVRYLALSCQDKHNTEFFDQCCHPLLRWQKLSDRPAQCTPSPSASASAVLAEPTASVIDEDPVSTDCETSTEAPAAVSTPAATTTKKAASSAPEPTSTVEPVTEAPKSTTPASTTRKAKVVAPTTTAEPTTSAAPSTGGDGGEVFTGGFATFFTQNGATGACGDKHGDDDLIVAADYRRYGALDKQSDLCGKKVRITNTDNGKQVTAIVADACPTCTNSNSLDLSLGAFDAIGARDTGMLPISWKFL